MSDHEWIRVSRDDGRELEVLLAGDPGDFPFVYHGGTPTAAAPWPRLQRLARERHVRLITYSRPGYGESSPQSGRGVGDAARDVAAILDHLGEADFITAGWSGGGPHAVACAALLSDRCRAAACIASVAPYGATGLDWLAGMGPENVEEFSAVLEGESTARPVLLKLAAEFAVIEPHQIADALGQLVPSVDREALTGEFAEWLAAAARRSVSHGIEGWLDDDVAFVSPWGFDLVDISRPVAIWQGLHDRMVPYAHGEWLAEHIPTAVAHLNADDGHLSLAVSKLNVILDDLMRLGEVVDPRE